MIQAIDMVDRNDRIKLLRIQRKKATSSRSCSQHRKIARQNAYTNSQLRNKNIEYKLKTKTHTPYFDPEQSNKMRRKKNNQDYLKSNKDKIKWEANLFLCYFYKLMVYLYLPRTRDHTEIIPNCN